MNGEGWFAVSASAELVAGDVGWVQLAGEELALWRDATGTVNAWADRCPHRGVRLSIGENLGTELRCRYHGWRFAAGSGACTAIPAHPNLKPSATLRVATYACREAFGFVWVNLHGDAGEPHLALDDERPTVARSVVIHAPLADVAAALEGYDEHDDAAFSLQPMNDAVTVVHAAIRGDLAVADRAAALREHDLRMCALRDRLERSVAAP